MKSDDTFRKLVQDTRAARKRVRHLVATKQWRAAEPDKARLSAFVSRTAEFTHPRGAEALQGNTVDFQPVSFLPIGSHVQRAVGYVEAMAAGLSCSGSGFLISPDLFITNQHVIPDITAARGAQIVFDRQMDVSGRPMPTTTFLLDPDRCAIFSDEKVLDYAVIAIGERTAGAASLRDLGFCPLSNRPDKHIIGMNVNIIQHPAGAPKLIAIRNNLLTFRTDRSLLYETDTDHGSSGSPVYNDLWEVVALHHFGEPFLADKDENGRPIPQTVNEGVRISAIYSDLEARAATLPAPARALVLAALAYDKQPSTDAGDRTLGPPRPSHPSAESAELRGSQMTTTPQASAQGAATASELKVVVPLEISIRIGGAQPAALSAESAPNAASSTTLASPAAPAAKELSKGSERLRVDADYGNRSGYDPHFIPDVAVPLPTPGPELAKQIAPLRPGEANADAGLLVYEHFSLIMNRSKRVALFTATNIDGETYLNVNRKTGKVDRQAEGEVWITDPRISASFTIGQDFYSNWSTYFDRGHLTRRSDPTWGTPAEAERANADTYHFTNCSPQHYLFNESSNYWQGAEIYVLEQGVEKEDGDPRLCVFQGPIYSDQIDRYADDIQIPSSFFKVIVWKGKAGVLKSVGLVVDQLALLDKKRSFVKVGTDKPVQVAQWRVAIGDIAKRTGLVFPQVIVDADTIGQATAPTVGEAGVAGLRLQSLDDIKL